MPKVNAFIVCRDASRDLKTNEWSIAGALPRS